MRAAQAGSYLYYLFFDIMHVGSHHFFYTSYALLYTFCIFDTYFYISFPLYA